MVVLFRVSNCDDGRMERGEKSKEDGRGNFLFRRIWRTTIYLYSYQTDGQLAGLTHGLDRQKGCSICLSGFAYNAGKRHATR